MRPGRTLPLHMTDLELGASGCAPLSKLLLQLAHEGLGHRPVGFFMFDDFADVTCFGLF